MTNLYKRRLVGVSIQRTQTRLTMDSDLFSHKNIDYLIYLASLDKAGEQVSGVMSEQAGLALRSPF